MGALSKKLRDIKGGILHWCPGCDGCHAIWITEPNPLTGAKWTWDGNVDQPTFSPSILVFTEYDDKHQKLPDGQRRTLCHYFIRQGRIEFCGDSPHHLAGQTVELPDWPPDEDGEVE